MTKRKVDNKSMTSRNVRNKIRAIAAGGAAISTAFGFTMATAPVANALSFPAYTLHVAAEGSQPQAPRFFDSFSNTVNVAGSETAEYALELVGSLYNNAGIFGCNQNSDKRTCNTSQAVLPSTDTYDNYDHDVVSNAQAVGSAAGVQQLCSTPNAVTSTGASSVESSQLPFEPAAFSGPFTATAGTTTTITDTNMAWAAGQLVGSYVTVGGVNYPITADAAVAPETSVSTITVSGTFATTPTAGTSFAIGNSWTATSGTSTTISDSGASWAPGQWVNDDVSTSGTGSTTYLVTSSTATTLTVSPAFSTTPGSGTTFSIAAGVWPYYQYPVPGSTEEADGIPIDLVRASASETDLAAHGVTVCSGLAEQAIGSDAVIGLSFSPASPDPDGAAIQDVAPPTIDFSNTGGAETATDTAWRVFCAPVTDPLAITTWDQLYEAEGLSGAPSPDQPLVLWGPKNNSGTGATWYTFAGCGTTTGRILSDHLVTENDAQQLSQYAAQNVTGSILLNTQSCPANTSVSGEACGPDGTTGASAASDPTDNCGGTGVGSGLGTATYTTANEKCVDQEVADSLFFMSYGYSISHVYTAAVTIPTAAIGSSPSYLDSNATNYQVGGNPSTIGGASVSGALLGQPGAFGAVPGDPRATNSSAVQTGRDLWLDYLTANVRASAASFVNWVCDEGDFIAPKGVDLTTGQPIDNEITSDITGWGFGRLSCDGGTGAYNARGSTYTTPITQAVVDPGPYNNE